MKSGHNIFVPYRIVFTENAADDFNSLSAQWVEIVPDSIRVFLTDEPTRQSRSRIKRLRDLRHPQFRLRMSEIQVYYDVPETDVVIIAIMTKEKAIEWLKDDKFLARIAESRRQYKEGKYKREI